MDETLEQLNLCKCCKHSSFREKCAHDGYELWCESHRFPCDKLHRCQPNEDHMLSYDHEQILAILLHVTEKLVDDFDGSDIRSLRDTLKAKGVIKGVKHEEYL